MQNVSIEIKQFWEQTDKAKVAEEIYAQDSLRRLSYCSKEEMLLLFRHYRLFTIRHIDDLCWVLARLPFSEFKAFVSKVLFEEFGMETEQGYESNHVHLLDAFMVSLGADQSFCEDPELELESNMNLLDELTTRVKKNSIAYAIGLRGMGTECLCQVYLTTIFNMVEKNPYFIKNKHMLDLRFEQLHRGPVEIEHRVKMRERIMDIICKGPYLLPELKDGYECARSSFHKFFANIYNHIDKEMLSGRSSIHANKASENPDTIFK